MVKVKWEGVPFELRVPSKTIDSHPKLRQLKRGLYVSLDFPQGQLWERTQWRVYQQCLLDRSDLITFGPRRLAEPAFSTGDRYPKGELGVLD
jgi:hypothetical protein